MNIDYFRLFLKFLLCIYEQFFVISMFMCHPYFNLRNNLYVLFPFEFCLFDKFDTVRYFLVLCKLFQPYYIPNFAEFSYFIERWELK
jgi:hypothetical protein